MNESAVTSQAYARWRSTRRGAITERVEMGVVFDLIGALRGKRVLDVGTGDGAYALGAAARGALVTAIDVEQEMLDATLARATERQLKLDLHLGRAEALPFDDGSFDVVIAVTVLCFVSDAPMAVREMARVLTPGGHLVVGELNRFSVWAAERRVRGWFGANPWRQATFWSRSDLKELVHGARLRAGDVRGAIFFPPWGIAACGMAPLESFFTRIHAPGAAFLALAADKPEVP